MAGAKFLSEKIGTFKNVGLKIDFFKTLRIFRRWRFKSNPKQIYQINDDDNWTGNFMISTEKRSFGSKMPIFQYTSIFEQNF